MMSGCVDAFIVHGGSDSRADLGFEVAYGDTDVLEFDRHAQHATDYLKQ